MRAHEFIIEDIVEDETEFRIPAENWGRLQDDIENLNKKGAKIGAEPITVNVIRTEVEKGKRRDGEETQRKYFIVSVQGKAPKIEGWRLIAALDYENGGVVARVIPGEDMPPEFRDTDPSRCDHCQTRRDRVNSFIVQHDSGEVKQVGRSCLKNFLGHENPKSIVSMAEILRRLDGIMDEVQDREGSYGGGGQPDSHDMETYLAYVSAVIKQYGWVPRSASSELHTATSMEAFSHMYPTPKFRRDPERVEPTEKDYDLARKAIAWVREELPKKKETSRGLSDYEHNLIVLTSGDLFRGKHAGFVASVVPAYQRWMDNEIKYAERKKQQQSSAGESDYVGEVGMRFGAKKIDPLKLKFLSARWIESAYGSVGIHKFVDDKGNYFVWFASTDPDLDQGHWYDFAASVKKHEMDKYNNNAKTTYLTRMKMLKDLGAETA